MQHNPYLVVLPQQLLQLLSGAFQISFYQLQPRLQQTWPARQQRVELLFVQYSNTAIVS